MHAALVEQCLKTAHQALDTAHQAVDADLASSMKKVLDSNPDIAHRALVFVLQDECLVTAEVADSYIKLHREV